MNSPLQLPGIIERRRVAFRLRRSAALTRFFCAFLSIAVLCVILPGLTTFGLGILPESTLSLSASALYGEEANLENSPTLKLYLQNNDSLVGRVIDSDKPGILRYQSSLFSTPFEFPIEGIQKLEFPDNEARANQDQDYSFELSGGDVLFGKLVSLGLDEMEIDASGFGRVHLQTSRLRRIARGVLGPDGTRVPELVYLGPNGLDKWDQLNEQAKAREENGAVVLDKQGASVSSDVGLPLKAIIECELSWKAKSEFLLAFGVSKSDSSVKSAFGLEVWEKDLVARRETDTEADVASITELKPEDSSIHLLIFLNRIEGRMQVFSSDGKQLADLEVRELDPRLVTGVRFTNKTGEVRLQRLRVSNWSGDLVPAVAWEKPRIHKADGSLVLGRPSGFDTSKGEIIVQEEGGGETRFPIDQVANIFVPSSDAPKLTGTRLQLTNGTRISGQLIGVRDASLIVQPPGIREQLTAPLKDVHSLNALERSDRYPKAKGNAILQADGVALHGWLEKSDPKLLASKGPLIWHPEMSETAGHLQKGAAANITLSRTNTVTPTPTPSGRTPTKPVKPAVNKDVLGFNLPKRPQAAVPADTPPKPRPVLPVAAQPCLYLISGDTIPCKLTKIDDKGIGFESTMTSSKFVPHRLIKAVVMIPEQVNSRRPSPVQPNFPVGVRIMGRVDPRVTAQQQQSLDERKKERLLTLPRMQKTNPPTHLICAQNGDYLRGRIIEMNDEMLRIELRLETREIPRDRISKIIWLHPEEVTGKNPDEPEGDEASPAVPEAEGIRVHVVRSNGIRLTFNALNVDSEKISGINATLGPCEAPFNEVGKVLIGSAIEEAAAETAFQQFKLQLATEPLAPPESEGGGSERTGRESPLVGKDAPDIRLKLLAGGDFNLDEKQGKIVLIDFWASWCGPCRRTLPLVHSVAGEFRERGVELITVNLEESSDQISDALERLQLDMPVAMDVTGKVGGKYAVTSIPSTVIVDKQGKIARVYVGGSDDFDEELRTALGELLGDVKPSEAEPEKKDESETATDPVKESPPTN